MRINNYVVCFSVFLLMIFMLACQSEPNKLANAKGKKSEKKSKRKKKVTNKQKNVLFIYVDDLRPELNCYGASHIHSPNIDQLAQNGMLFNKAYAQWSVCGPSRASLLTGLRPAVTRVFRNKHNFRKTMPNLLTLPEAFKENNYATKSIGKVFHSFKMNDAQSWSEGSWFGSRDLNARGYVLETNQVRSEDNKLGPATEVSELADSVYRDGQFANKAIEFLNEHQDQAFFLALGFEKPHLPLAAPQKYWDLYDRSKIKLPSNKKPTGIFTKSLNGSKELERFSGINLPLNEAKGKEIIHGYYACVSFVDAQIGKVMAELKRLGLDKNTIVVLCGDHGWKLGEYGEWCKKSNFEVDTRTPLIISSPDIKQKGTQRNEIVELIDLYPTLCDLANIEAPNYIQGESLKPLLMNKEKPSDYQDIAFSQLQRNLYMGYAIRTPDYRYVKWVNESGKYTLFELYDLKKDPNEMVNVAEDKTYKHTRIKFNKLLVDSIQTWKKRHELISQK